VLAAMPTVGEIGSADLCGCGFVKGESAAHIVAGRWNVQARQENSSGA